MQDLVHTVATVDMLSAVERKRFVSACGGIGLGDSERDRILLGLCAHGAWAILKSLLRYSEPRKRLGAMIQPMQDQASARGESIELLNSLPKRLDAESAKVALLFPLQTHSWEVANGLIERGAYLIPSKFLRLCERYNEVGSAFDRALIARLLKKEMVDWPKALGFHPTDGWRELMARGLENQDPSLLLCASCLMTSKQILKSISQTGDKTLLLLQIQHMQLPLKWQQAIPAAFREVVLADQLGL